MLSNINDMYAYVLTGVNKANQATVDPDEFDILINAAQFKWVKKKCALVEIDQRHSDDLRLLVEPAVIIPNSGLPSSEEELFALPYVATPAIGGHHGYLHALSVGAKMMKMSNGQSVPCSPKGGFVGCRFMPRDTRYDRLRDPFWKPTDVEPYYYEQANVMKVLGSPDSFCSEIRLEYVRHPRRMSMTSTPQIQPELQVDVNLQIAELAIRLYLEITENPRYRSKLTEDQLTG